MVTGIARWITLGAGLALAAILDVRERRIPNWLTAPLAALGFLFAAASDTYSLRSSAAGFTVALLFGAALWLLGAVKAGDAKLMAAAGAMAGTLWFADCMTWALLAGLAIGVAILLRKGELRARMFRLGAHLKNLFLSRRYHAYHPGTEQELPFAVPMLIGAILAYFLPIWRI